MASPCLDTVFSIPELLETVLLQLSLRDLLHAQRVSQVWKDIIKNSPLLQKKLFFQPISDEDHEPEFNPFFQSLFPPFFDLDDFGSQYDCHKPSAIYELEWYKDGDFRGRVMRPEASWRRMFPVQPPAKIEHVTLRGGCYCSGEERTEGAIRDEFQTLQGNGATMGFIWDVTVHLMDSVPEGTFYVQWHMFPQVDKEGIETDVERDVVEVSDGVLKVVLEKGITLQIGQSFSCYPKAPVPCELTVADCDPRIIEYEKVKVPRWQRMKHRSRRLEMLTMTISSEFLNDGGLVHRCVGNLC
jgi:F-box domain